MVYPEFTSDIFGRQGYRWEIPVQGRERSLFLPRTSPIPEAYLYSPHGKVIAGASVKPQGDVSAMVFDENTFALDVTLHITPDGQILAGFSRFLSTTKTGDIYIGFGATPKNILGITVMNTSGEPVDPATLTQFRFTRDANGLHTVSDAHANHTLFTVEPRGNEYVFGAPDLPHYRANITAASYDLRDATAALTRGIVTQNDAVDLTKSLHYLTRDLYFDLNISS